MALPKDLDTYIGWEWMVSAAMMVMLEFDLSLDEVCALKEGDYDRELKRLRVRGEWHDLGEASFAILDELFKMTWPDFGVAINHSGKELDRISARDGAEDFQYRPLFWKSPGHVPIHEQLRRAIEALHARILPQ